jgi:hypothetical protein
MLILSTWNPPPEILIANLMRSAPVLAMIIATLNLTMTTPLLKCHGFLFP